MTNNSPNGNALASFFRTGRIARYAKGEVIVRGDDTNPELHYVEKGFIKVYSINDQGDEYLHIIYKPGDIFPIIWAFRDVRRHVFYESMSSAVLWKMPKETMVNYVEAHSNPAIHMLLKQMAEQFNVYADRLDNLQYKSAYQRVVYRLLFLAGRFGKKIPEGILIDAPLTHKVIAESINLARESVSREMELLESKGLIDSIGNKIVIIDAKKLSKEFSEPVSLDYWGLRAN